MQHVRVAADLFVMHISHPLQEQIKLLTERKYELASAEDDSKASPEEQQEALMARIKRDNAAVERATAQAKQLQEEVRQLEAAVTAANARQSGRSAGAGGDLPPAQDEESRRYVAVVAYLLCQQAVCVWYVMFCLAWS